MARLKEPPQKGSTYHLSPPPPSSHTSTDAGAATRQLFAESRASASASKPSRERAQSQSSAVLGAHLLNAARADFRHSSPIRTARRRANNGKLPRASLTAERPRQNLARERNVYDLPESPEKAAFRLPETVNQQPLTVLRKRRVPDKQHSDSRAAQAQAQAQAPANGKRDGQPVEESPLPSSPPRIALDSERALNTGDDDASDVHIEERLASGAARCAMVSYKNNKLRGPTYEQCHNAGTKVTDHGPRCPPHERKPGLVRCQYLTHHDGHKVQCRTPAIVWKTRCSKHTAKQSNLGDQHSGRNTCLDVKRMSEHDHNVSSPPDKAAKKHIHATEDPTGSRRANGRRTRSTAPATQGTKSASTESRPKKRVKSNRPPWPSSSTPNKPSREMQDRVDESIDETQSMKRTARSPYDMDNIFQFLTFEERSGRCETDLGRSIKHVCDSTYSLLQETDLADDDITESIEDIRRVLKTITETTEDIHRSLKSDIYCHVFYSLAQVLQALHCHFTESAGDITKSLETLRLFVPFMRDILALKDAVAGWKVAVPQRYKGDRIVKDVDSHLIAPLREVEKNLSRRLSQLETKERSRQKLVDVQHQLEEEQFELLRQEEALAARKKRWKRWQELHIKRMQCEVDPLRRRKLVIIKFEDLEEKDANGLKFERLPLFRNRLAPPLRWASTIAQEARWSAKQETALIDGLKTYAGPHVFDNICDKQCRPGGLLREFSVTEIIAKASWVRSSYEKLQQEHGWELPAWVKQMPTLP